MMKLAIFGFFLVIAISHVASAHSQRRYKQEIIQWIKRAIYDRSFTAYVMDCMHADARNISNNRRIAICYSEGLLDAREQIILAYEYENITQNCLSGEPDKMFVDCCDIYRAVKDRFPDFWNRYLDMVRYGVEHLEEREIIGPNDEDYHDWLKENPKAALKVAQCIINRQPCKGPITHVKDLVIHAEKFENCLDSRKKDSEGCSLLSIFQTYYTTLWEQIKAQGRLHEFDSDLKVKTPFTPKPEHEL